MRTPSAELLVFAFPHLGHAQARLVQELGRAVDDVEYDEYESVRWDYLRDILESGAVPHADARARRAPGDPWVSRIWRVNTALRAINEVVGGYGVKGIGAPRAGDRAPPYAYVDFGDPRSPTLIYDRRADRLYVGTVKDLADRHSSWRSVAIRGNRGQRAGRAGELFPRTELR